MQRKSKCSAALFEYILIVLNLAYNKNKLYKTLDYWSENMFSFNFLEKGLLKYPHHIYAWFFKKIVSHVMLSQ